MAVSKPPRSTSPPGIAGRVVEIFAFEGDFVQAGQVLAQMQIDVLNAQRDEARAQQQQAITGVASAEAQVEDA